MKYTKEIASQIAKLIEDGNYAKVAAAACDISEETFYNWQRPDQADSTPNPDYHSEFSELIKKSEAKRIVTLISEIRTDKAWTARCWILERTDRELYSPQSEHEIVDRLDKLESILEEIKREKHI